MLSCVLHSHDSEASVQCNHIPAPQKETSEKGIGTVNVDQLQPRGFNGYESISSHDEQSEVLKDLTGVSAACFGVLLGMLEGHVRTGYEDRLFFAQVFQWHEAFKDGWGSTEGAPCF